MKKELLSNIDKVHTTILGRDRIKKNVNEKLKDIDSWCKKLIEDSNSVITKKGKNYYINTFNYIITINASSYTIITVHAL